jgi:hypothetical protein
MDSFLHPDILIEHKCNESIFKTSQIGFNKNDLLQFETEGLTSSRENTMVDLSPRTANSPLRRRLQDVAMAPINNWNKMNDSNFMNLPKEKWIHP